MHLWMEQLCQLDGIGDLCWADRTKLLISTGCITTRSPWFQAYSHVVVMLSIILIVANYCEMWAITSLITAFFEQFIELQNLSDTNPVFFIMTHCNVYQPDLYSIAFSTTFHQSNCARRLLLNSPNKHDNAASLCKLFFYSHLKPPTFLPISN